MEDSRLYKVLQAFSCANGNLNKLQKEFDKIAKAAFHSGYFLVNKDQPNEFKIEITCIEFYYHEINGIIKDNKKIFKNFKLDIFPVGSLVPHNYGIDINFDDNIHQEFRASFLIRGYRKIEGTNIYENNTKSKNWNPQDLWYDLFGCANCLNGNKMEIEWIDNGLPFESVPLPEPQQRIFNTKDKDFNPNWLYSKTTQDYCHNYQPIALLIGQDPRLQLSDTIASYALFADYFFKKDSELKNAQERCKKRFATSAYQQIVDISNGIIHAEDIYVTNLCNEILPHSKCVLIPSDIAKQGCTRIKQILKDFPSIKYIFPMGTQVNYWLVKFDLYQAPDFLDKAQPHHLGQTSDPPYYTQSQKKAFLNICGEKFQLDNDRYLFPILHSRQYPPKGKMIAYENQYKTIREFFEQDL